MSHINSTRTGCKDVFHAFLVKNATYDGFLEIPTIDYGIYKPSKLISFSKCISSKDFDCWIHFYEDDAAFERIWKNPKKYLPILKRFAGVISPDFSMYRDMPLVMQFWNIYRNRAIGRWLQDNGIKIIVNVRFGDQRTYDICCFGVPKHSCIAIGSHGCIKLNSDRKLFVEGLEHIVKKIEPQRIVVYGAVPDSIFEKYRSKGIDILHFASDFAVARGKG